LARIEFQIQPSDNLTAQLSQAKPRFDSFIDSLKERKDDEQSGQVPHKNNYFYQKFD